MRKNPKKINKKLVILTSVFVVALFIGTSCSTATTVDSFSSSREDKSTTEAVKLAVVLMREKEKREASLASINVVEEPSAETIENEKEKESEPDASSLTADNEEEPSAETIENEKEEPVCIICEISAVISEKSLEEILREYDPDGIKSEEVYELFRNAGNVYNSLRIMSDTEKLSFLSYVESKYGDEVSAVYKNLPIYQGIPDVKIMAHASASHSSSATVVQNGNSFCEDIENNWQQFLTALADYFGSSPFGWGNGNYDFDGDGDADIYDAIQIFCSGLGNGLGELATILFTFLIGGGGAITEQFGLNLGEELDEWETSSILMALILGSVSLFFALLQTLIDLLCPEDPCLEVGQDSLTTTMMPGTSAVKAATSSAFDTQASSTQTNYATSNTAQSTIAIQMAGTTHTSSSTQI